MISTDYLSTLHYAGDDLFVGTTPSGHAQVIDFKGDRHSAASPLELLLLSLMSCTAADVISILKKKRQQVDDYDVQITGTRKDDHPRAFLTFKIHHIVRGRSVSEKALADAIELSESKYCSVAATVRPGVAIETSYEIIETESV